MILPLITHCAACYIPHKNYSLCSLLYSSQQLLTVQPSIFLTAITHCAACYIAHIKFPYFYVFQPKCWLHLLFVRLTRRIRDTLLDVCRKWMCLIIAFQGGLLQLNLIVMNCCQCNFTPTASMICAGNRSGGTDVNQVTGSW